MIVWGGCDAQTCGPGGNSDRFGLKNGGRCSRTQRQTDRPRSLLVLFVDRYDRSRSALRFSRAADQSNPSAFCFPQCCLAWSLSR